MKLTTDITFEYNGRGEESFHEFLERLEELVADHSRITMNIGLIYEEEEDEPFYDEELDFDRMQVEE